jgi:hypothetical protein
MPENPSDLHVVGRTADGQLWHTIRSPGGWTGLGDVLEAANLPALRGHVVDVACTRRMDVPGVEDGLYVLVAFDNEPPRLLFRISNGEPNAGTWSQKPGAAFRTARARSLPGRLPAPPTALTGSASTRSTWPW